MHICVFFFCVYVCVWVHGSLARALCQQEAGVGRQPCIAHCPSAWPSVCRLRPLYANATQSRGARGWEGGEKGWGGGLKEINHGRERRAGGRRMEGCGDGEESGWLAAHLIPPPLSLCPVSFIFYLCLCWWAVMYRERSTGRETHAVKSLFASPVCYQGS